MRRIFLLLLLGVVFFLLSFFIARSLFLSPQTALPAQFVSLNRYWLGAFFVPRQGKELVLSMSNSHLVGMW